MATTTRTVNGLSTNTKRIRSTMPRPTGKIKPPCLESAWNDFVVLDRD